MRDEFESQGQNLNENQPTETMWCEWEAEYHVTMKNSNKKWVEEDKSGKTHTNMEESQMDVEQILTSAVLKLFEFFENTFKFSLNEIKLKEFFINAK